MTRTHLSTMLSESKLEDYLESEGALPLVQLFGPELDAWSSDHERVLRKIADADNGGRVFKTLTGYPEKADLGTLDQCEAQIVEFVSFYGQLIDLSRPRIERIATDVIRASPVADARPDVWTNDDRAGHRISELYEFVEERRSRTTASDLSEASTSEQRGQEGTDVKHMPQDLSNVTTTPSVQQSTEREKNLRKDLFGK